MEKKPRKKIVSCRLVVHQESGRIRWCVGQEKKWQTWLKKLAFVPIILLPVVVIIILVSKYNIGASNESGLNSRNIIDANVSSIRDVEMRQKRHTQADERFSHPLKRCYKLYLKLYPYRESFLETENNREQKFDLLNANPTYFRRNFAVYFRENRDKHRRLKKCLGTFWEENRSAALIEQKKQAKRMKRNSTKRLITNTGRPSETVTNEVRTFWANKLTASEVREEQSKIMKKYMNPDIDPCDNFYEYACGNWKKYYDIPPDKSVYDTFEMVRENLYLVLRELLESDLETDKQSEMELSSYHNPKDFVEASYEAYDISDATIKAKKFYKSCMNEEIINKRAEKPLQKLLEELGGWPITTPNWKKSDFDLMWVLSRLRLLNNDILISQWVGPDINNSNKHIIHIDQTTLGLPNRDYFLDSSNSNVVKAYKSFILSIANLLGAPTNTAIKDVNIVEFETKLASILSPVEKRRNITEIYQRITIETLINRYPNFGWYNYFTIILGKEIDLKSTVACYCARYIQQLLTLLNKTNPRTIQNYLLWRFIRHRTSNLDHRFLESEQKFYQTLLGRQQQPPRWQFCISHTNTNMGMALGALFVRHYFDESSKSDTIKITEEIMQAFTDMLEEKHWLDNDTKNFAQTKINNMNLKIGFPSSLLNKTELNLRYSDIKIEEHFFFENVLSVLRHTSRADQRKIDLFVDKSVWNTPPAIVNAYYSRNKNQILFPAGILQPPFYHKFFPKSLNFGGIGVVIGHEITHAFDDKGRLFDHEGNLQLWWNNDAIEKFYEKSQCIIDQYGRYILPGIATPLDGMITQGENIADNGGLKQAFRAYENWVAKNPNVDETLPGLNMTGFKLFFLNFAQVWCGKQRIESARSRIKTSVHSPGIFRVIGALSNSEEFSRIYNCPKHSPMNPPQKCDLW